MNNRFRNTFDTFQNLCISTLKLQLYWENRVPEKLNLGKVYIIPVKKFQSLFFSVCEANVYIENIFIEFESCPGSFEKQVLCM